MTPVTRRYPITLAGALLGLLAGCSPEPEADTDRFAVSEITVPASMASMGPNLAQGPDGMPVLSWIDRGSGEDFLRYSRWQNGGWSDPATVVSGDNWFVNWADFPSVVPVSATLWGAHWLVKRAAGGYAYDAFSAVSNDAGRTWGDGFTLHRDGTDTEHGFVMLYPRSGGIGAIWLDGRKMINDVEIDPTSSGMTLRAATVSNEAMLSDEEVIDELVCDCCQTDVAVTSSGPVAVYRNRSVDEIRDIYVSRLEDNAWQPGIAVNDDNWEIGGCPVNGPAIVADGDDVAVTWFTTVDEIPRVRLARSNDAGRTFSAPIEIATGDNVGRVAAALSEDGGVAVAWLSPTAAGTHQLMLRRVSADGEAGPVHIVQSGIAAFSFPQMLSVDDQLLVAWTAAQDEGSRVGSALVSLP